MHNFLGQGLNLHDSSDQSYSSASTRFLAHCNMRELPMTTLNFMLGPISVCVCVCVCVCVSEREIFSVFLVYMWALWFMYNNLYVYGYFKLMIS